MMENQNVTPFILIKNTVDAFESIYSTILWNIQNSLGKGSGWIIDSVIDNNINISKYDPLAGRSYIKLPKELSHPKSFWLIFKILMIRNAFYGV